MKFKSFLSCLVIVAFAAGCQQDTAPETGALDEPVVDIAGETEAILAFEASYENAYNTRDSDALAAHYTASGEWLPPDAPRVTGSEAIRALSADNFAQMPEGIVADIVFEDLIVAGSGDLAAGSGTFNVSGEAPDGTLIDQTSQWIATYVKEDGQWKMSRVIWNMGPEIAGATE